MDTERKNVIRVGSRKSELALIQTNYVIDCLKKLYPHKEFTIVTMTTLGDRILNVSLPKIGEKSLFTKDLEDALRSNTVDFVVHSLKDLPTSLPDGLAIGAVFEREDPRDALVLREDLKGSSLASLPAGSVIGTSSLRRTAQLRAGHPHLEVADVRGNLNTRLRKLDDGGYAALLLASAGLTRMGWGNRISKVLPCAEMKYAVGQGALAVECRVDNDEVLDMLAPYSHAETYCRVLAERSFLKTLGGGCSAPVGVSTTLKPFEGSYKLSITGCVWSLDGQTKVDHKMEQTFKQIKRSTKHKLSPQDEGSVKKVKEGSCEKSEGSCEKSDGSCEKSAGSCESEGSEKSEGSMEKHVLEHPLVHLDRKVLEKTSCEDVKRIFCGLSENTSVPIDVIVKCDDLGRDLAEALIAKGALDVMKVTQDLIRSSIERS